ncbi:MAG TPA: DKNYY domain-containing protein [Bacteroidia bacterium]|nr:DKNYY domain-containing protein [Bacteroidia bacterium]
MKHVHQAVRFICCATLLSFITSCGTQAGEKEPRPGGRKNDSSTGLPADYKNYVPAANGFYRGKDGAFYILTRADDIRGEHYDTRPYFRKVNEVDPATFHDIDAYGIYAEDSFHVFEHFHMAEGDHIFLLDSADRNSFTVMGYRNAKDKHHVYSDNEALDLDPSSLVIVDADSLPDGRVYIGCMKDKQRVYFEGEEQGNVDAPSFHLCSRRHDTVIFCDKYRDYRSCDQCQGLENMK